MELPTYTNIWKIEKRLYKLYDFRLPMPLPVGQVTAFLAIALPYTLILTLVGMPFSHNWVWLYALPPGVLAWLVTRPVLEGKRLPELVLSQVRYLSEPRTWCRLAPVAEKDHMAVVARVWRAPSGQALATSSHPEVRAEAQPVLASTVPPAWPDRPAVGAPSAAAATEADSPVGAPSPAAATEADSPVGAPSAAPAAEVRLRVPADSVGVPGSMAVTARAAAARSATTAPPVVTVRADAPAGRPLNVVERALRNPAGGWRDQVVVVPGGHRPGKPDHTQRDQARARLPLPGPARIIVLGTTAGAGQTVTTLLTGQLLASLRGEAVAVLDFARQPGSLTELARQVPRLLPSRLAVGDQAASQGGSRRKRGLQVVTADHSGPGPRDADTLIEAVVARYPITLADPDAADVPRALQVADQLVLVTPVGEHSAGSLGMTLEWLDAHGHGRLAQAAITVLNGVSERTAPYTGRAIGVATGRCRAIVRVPWDSRLAAGGALDTATVHAYTSLAGALISGLADAVPADSSGAGSASR